MHGVGFIYIIFKIIYIHYENLYMCVDCVYVFVHECLYYEVYTEVFGGILKRR